MLFSLLTTIDHFYAGKSSSTFITSSFIGNLDNGLAIMYGKHGRSG